MDNATDHAQEAQKHCSIKPYFLYGFLLFYISDGVKPTKWILARWQRGIASRQRFWLEVYELWESEVATGQV